MVPKPSPFTANTLEWECLKDLNSVEVSVERINELFNRHRGQVRQGLLNKRTELERRPIQIHKTGAEEAAPGVPASTLEGGEAKVGPIPKVGFVMFITCRYYRLMTPLEKRQYRHNQGLFARYTFSTSCQYHIQGGLLENTGIRRPTFPYLQIILVSSLSPIYLLKF